MSQIKRLIATTMAIAASVMLLSDLFAQREYTIYVLSDPHVMAPELLESDGAAWQSFLNSDRKLVDYSVPLFDEAVARIIDAHPDLVLITGDLTKDGELVSHKHVVSRLDQLRDAGVPTLVIPGNHDMGTGNALYYDGDKTRRAEVPTAQQFATLYANYGYEGTERLGSTLNYCCEPLDGLVIIGIDSGTNGKISASTLDWVCQHADSACHAGKQPIVLMHHPLVPHFTGVEKFVSTAFINDYENVRDRLSDAGVNMVLTGHFHTSDIARDYNEDFSRTIYDVNTGSLATYPCNYRILTLDKTRRHLTMQSESITSLPDNDDFATVAKARLRKAIEYQINQQGNAYTYISPMTADAFIAHAEGDEHRSPSAAIALNNLLSSAELARFFGVVAEEKLDDLVGMASSMLQDITQYHVEQREDQTDDLLLELELPLPVEIADDTEESNDNNSEEGNTEENNSEENNSEESNSEESNSEEGNSEESNSEEGNSEENNSEENNSEESNSEESNSEEGNSEESNSEENNSEESNSEESNSEEGNSDESNSEESNSEESNSEDSNSEENEGAVNNGNSENNNDSEDPEQNSSSDDNEESDDDETAEAKEGTDAIIQLLADPSISKRPIFNLCGQSVNRLCAGLYVLNNTKFIIR